MYFAVIGNDNRMDYVAQQLYSLGCDVSRDLSRLQRDSVIILPPPVKSESIDIIGSNIDNIVTIYGGNISKEFINKLPDSIKVYDYLTWDNVIAENARLTANGIIKEAYQNKAWFNGSKVLVTGFGYCGKALASALKEQLANVTVAVRNHNLKNDIVAMGYEYFDIGALAKENTSEFSYVFNTVPALVIDSAVIDRLAADVCIYDIASKPGGTNFNYCHEKNIKAILSLGIPGRVYPEEAGNLIANAIYQHISL